MTSNPPSFPDPYENHENYDDYGHYGHPAPAPSPRWDDAEETALIPQFDPHRPPQQPGWAPAEPAPAPGAPPAAPPANWSPLPQGAPAPAPAPDWHHQQAPPPAAPGHGVGAPQAPGHWNAAQAQPAAPAPAPAPDWHQPQTPPPAADWHQPQQQNPAPGQWAAQPQGGAVPQAGQPWGGGAAAAVGAEMDQAGYVWRTGRTPGGAENAPSFAWDESAAPAAEAEPAAAPQAARTGSPIIDPGVESAVATLVFAALVAGGAGLGRFGLGIAVALLQAVTAAGWFRLNGMWPARQGIALAFLGGLAADAAALAVAGGGAVPEVLLGTLGVFFLLVLVLQVFRPADPEERFYALTVCASATVVTVLDCGFLGVLATAPAHGGQIVVVGALGAAFAVMIAAAAAKLMRSKAAFSIGLVAALATGWGLASAAGLDPNGGALVGAVAGACALIGRRVAAYDFPSRFVHRTAGVALPLACAAPLLMLLGGVL